MDPYLGEIRIFGGPYVPENWMACDGSLISIQQYQALYSLLGTTYGGDGRTTFGLPDLRGRVVVNQGTAATGTAYALAQKGGAETVTVTTAQLPSHAHTFLVSNTAGTQTSPSNAFLANPVDPTATNPKTVLNYLPDSAPETLQPLINNALTGAGGNVPHYNMQPYIVLNHIICVAAGNYPDFSQ
jgi:microcystin-dependent protein